MKTRDLTAPTSVYLYYDAADRLIYVGITNQGPGRAAQHAKKAEWWPYATRTVLEHYDDRLTATRRETELIRGYRPPFNKQGNPRWEAERAGYLAERAVGAPIGQDPAIALAEKLGYQVPLQVLGGEEWGFTFRCGVTHARIAKCWTFEPAPVVSEGGEVIGNAKVGYLPRLCDIQLFDPAPHSPSCALAHIETISERPTSFRVTQVEVSFLWPAVWKVDAA